MKAGERLAASIEIQGLLLTGNRFFEYECARSRLQYEVREPPNNSIKWIKGEVTRQSTKFITPFAVRLVVVGVLSAHAAQGPATKGRSSAWLATPSS